MFPKSCHFIANFADWKLLKSSLYIWSLHYVLKIPGALTLSIKIEAENLGIKGLFTQSGFGVISEEFKWLQYLSKHYVLYIRKCISWVADFYFIWCTTWFLLLLSCNHSMKCLIHMLFKFCSFYLEFTSALPVEQTVQEYILFVYHWCMKAVLSYY